MATHVVRLDNFTSMLLIAALAMYAEPGGDACARIYAGSVLVLKAPRKKAAGGRIRYGIANGKIVFHISNPALVPLIVNIARKENRSIGLVSSDPERFLDMIRNMAPDMWVRNMGTHPLCDPNPSILISCYGKGREAKNPNAARELAEETGAVGDIGKIAAVSAGIGKISTLRILSEHFGYRYDNRDPLAHLKTELVLPYVGKPKISDNYRARTEGVRRIFIPRQPSYRNSRVLAEPRAWFFYKMAMDGEQTPFYRVLVVNEDGNHDIILRTTPSRLITIRIPADVSPITAKVAGMDVDMIRRVGKLCDP